MDATHFKSGRACGTWLAHHHDTEPELLLAVCRTTSGISGITNAQALDEALAFGWIEGRAHGAGSRSSRSATRILSPSIRTSAAARHSMASFRRASASTRSPLRRSPPRDEGAVYFNLTISTLSGPVPISPAAYRTDSIARMSSPRISPIPWMYVTPNVEPAAKPLL
jgi:hypothetical protein